MYTLKDFKVGQKVGIQITGNARRRNMTEEESVIEGVVQKVGRKYVTVSSEKMLENKFRETTSNYGGLRQHTDFCVDYMLYPTQAEALIELRRKSLQAKIRTFFSSYQDTELSFGQLDAIYKIIGDECDVNKE